jgi:beta-N-acetylhexosaminidase
LEFSVDTLPVIFSLKGLELSDGERAFFKDSNPLGFILFGRNCETPEQLRALTDSLRDLLGRNCPVLIDQEGGRVQRLQPPIWRGYPSMQHFGAKAEVDMEDALSGLRYVILQLAEELREAGISVDCAPVMDVLSAATHEAIGDRAFSEDPEIVSRLGLSVCRNLLSAGITPVIKHIPGHGRAASDSHKELPRVETQVAALKDSDFKPFRDIASSDVAASVWGMTSHVLYRDIDPDHPASVSSTVIKDVIRGEIGFDGLLLSDDLDMKALDAYGDIAARTDAALKAGCDVALYCWAELDVMEKIAKTVPKISQEAQKRLQKAAKSSKLAA